MYNTDFLRLKNHLKVRITLDFIHTFSFEKKSEFEKSETVLVCQSPKLFYVFLWMGFWCLVFFVLLGPSTYAVWRATDEGVSPLLPFVLGPAFAIDREPA